jgi:hypothetical protein
MLTVHPQYITDTAGKKVAVIISMDESKTILDELDDAAKAANEPSVPIDEAFKLIEAKR